MLDFFRKPYLYCVTFSLALTLLLAWSLLAVFIIPKEMEQPGEEYETIDLSQFTTAPEDTDAPGDSSDSEPVYVLTLPSDQPSVEEPPEETADGTDSADGDEAITDPPVQYPVITENSYLDENISITITTVRQFGSNFHVADVKIRTPQYLKTALAQDTYGLNIKEKTSEQARRVNAILAINGDYYGANEKGYVIRNGVIWRKTLRPTDDKRRKYFDDLAILWNGTLLPFDEKTTSIDDLKSLGAVQVFAFGPTLLKNGEITVNASTEVGVSNPSGNPRTAICYVEEGHYLFVVADGRTDQSKGPTLLELAQGLRDLGAVTAYNLDGGGSATMYFNGKLVNNPCTNWNEIHEREVSDIVYIGY